MAEPPPCTLLLRGKAACKLVRGPDAAGATVEAVQCQALDTRAEFNSADGRLLAVVEAEGVRVLSRRGEECVELSECRWQPTHAELYLRAVEPEPA